LRLFDKLNNKKKIINAKKNNIKVFLCGPTVYDAIHFGHARFFLFFDLVYRLFKLRNIEPTMVINITDIDPKIVARSKDKGVEYSSLVEENIQDFLNTFEKLGLNNSFIYVKVSDYVDYTKRIIEKLIRDKKAYYSLGNIYLKAEFGTKSKLSGLSKEEMKDMRFDINPGKKSPTDILLWNCSDAFENLFNDSKLGNGVPWWHIQDVSVIFGIFSGKYDIHSGATDLILPHHEYISSILYSIKNMKKYPNIWMHVGLVYLKNKKMSKSTGHFISINDLLNKYNANTIRLYSYSENYHDPLFFSYKSINEYRKLENRINEILISENSVPDKNSSKIKKFIEYLTDDFNTVDALTVLKEAVEEKRYCEIKKMVEIFGLRY
jgi:cysteinyl-tRNA synthetase